MVVVDPGKRAQVSMEFLIVIGITFLFTIPLIILFTKESQSAGEQVALAQVSQIARRVVGSAESVYAFGEPTAVVLKVYMPPGVKSASISSNELIFTVAVDGNPVEVYEIASMNLTGNISVNPGIHNIRVTAIGTGVNISEFSG
mgnify:CR=1 FL=1